ncbi:hypothetical protein BV898_14877 [Hypsibius exemplaris]|uniref:Retrotransposon gag domain-containing protein n=1 Tax=Hypsibius exemplaris TaxID=2072580 RepID=A0A9X6RJP9_HYPEX|nr:hypothetical protein BV898_14877 [Hypsibius exemplaris]
MPSDNEKNNGSSGNGGRAQQRQQQRFAPPLASTSTAATTQGGVTVKTIADAVVIQQSQMAIRGPVIMPKFGNKGTEEIGMFLRRFKMAGHAQKWTDEDLLAMLRLSLEEGSGAEYWYVRTVIPGTWAELKDLMLKNFRPPTFLEYQQKTLARRVMKDTESINTYFEEVMKLYDVLESLGKAFTDLEKADKLTSGLHGNLFRDVTMIAPTTPQNFLNKSEKAINMTIRVQKKPQSSQVEILPNAIIDPVSLHGEQRQNRGNHRGNHFDLNYQETKGRFGQNNGGDRFCVYDDRILPYQPDGYKPMIVWKSDRQKTNLRDKGMNTNRPIGSGVTSGMHREVMTEKSGQSKTLTERTVAGDSKMNHSFKDIRMRSSMQNKPVIGPCTKGTIIGGKPTMKHANEFDGEFCAARRRTEVAQNSESTEEEYFIPDGRKVTTNNEFQTPQEPTIKMAIAPIVGELRERENSPEIPVQQPRRTTLQTAPLTNNTRPARKQRRKVEVS